MNQLQLPLALSLLLTACASSGVPNEKAESSSAAIRAAEEVGATHNPKAALHLQLAKEQFEFASKLSPDDERTSLLLARAEVDAELSLALARSEAEKAAALGAINQVKTLKESAPR